MTRSILPSATSFIRAALVVLPLAAAAAGCFPEIDVDKLKCHTSMQCPVDYICGADEKCCRSSDGVNCDMTSNDADSGNRPDSAKSDTPPGRLEVGNGDGVSPPVDGPGGDLAQDATTDAQPDVPLGLDTAEGDGPGTDHLLGSGGAPGTGGTTGRDAGADAPTGGISGTGGVSDNGGAVGTGGRRGTGGNGSGGSPPGTGGGLGGQVSTGGRVGTGGSGTGGSGTGGSGTGGSGTGGSGTGGSLGCVGMAWPTANPTVAGPFEVATDKEVGPQAGYTPDPIYGDQQQRFNIYRPKNLATSGYCHPILVWANGHTDNPEPNPPLCVVDSASNQWCGQYLPLMNHLASHGFVVIASLSTTTSRGDPLPTIAGLDWLLQQAEDSASPYYHHLDTTNVGQLGHSEGGLSTCMSASEPRYKALATICGTRSLTGVHTPMLFFCGGKDTTAPCSGVRNTFLTVTDQPAFFINELNSDHGWWVYQGANGVALSSAAAWFRVHLMGDTANRTYFYGTSCSFCTDSRVQVEQNSLMTQ
jgi:hypothetical protein